MTGAGGASREESRAGSRAEEVTVTACPDGPLLVRGPARLVAHRSTSCSLSSKPFAKSGWLNIVVLLKNPVR